MSNYAITIRQTNNKKQNNPYNIYYVAQRIAQIKGISTEEVIKQTTNNVYEIFDI